MSHDVWKDACAAYALGTLAASERARFEAHLAEGCAECAADLRAHGEAAALFARSAVASGAGSPPPRSRVRLLSEVSEHGYYFVAPHEGAWESMGAGVAIRRLWIDPHDGSETRLIHLAAGVTMVPDALPAGTPCFVVTGSARAGAVQLESGDYHRPAALDDARPRAETNSVLFAAGVGAIASGAKARTVRTREGRWRALGAGTHGMLLDADAARGTQTSIVRMDAGATLAEHDHGGPEESFLLEGECTTEGRDVPTHGYLRAPGGSHHGATHTRTGCRMIVVAARGASGHAH